MAHAKDVQGEFAIGMLVGLKYEMRNALAARPVAPHADLADRLRDEVRRCSLGHVDRYEEDAEAFYRATGYMAPGKSVPFEMAAGQDFESRSVAWDKWNRGRAETWKALLREAASVLAGENKSKS